MQMSMYLYHHHYGPSHYISISIIGDEDTLTMIWCIEISCIYLLFSVGLVYCPSVRKKHELYSSYMEPLLYYFHFQGMILMGLGSLSIQTSSIYQKD